MSNLFRRTPKETPAMALKVHADGTAREPTFRNLDVVRARTP